MSCFSEDVRNLFQTWKQSELCQKLEGHHAQLLERRTEAIAYGDPDKLSAKTRTRLNCQVLRQALLHRADRLLRSSGTMLLEKNVYGLALLARGHLEATAVLGFFCNRINTLSKRNIPFEKFEEDVAHAIMGAQHDLFAEASAPTNILSCIEKADRFLDSEIFKEKKGMLKDCYTWLSEFAHPNFLSNSTAFTLDKANGRMVFRHEGDLQEKDFELLGYLSISATIFTQLFDTFGQRAEAQLKE